MDDCETSLQVLRGFDADITAEVNDIKAHTYFHSFRLTEYSLFEESSLCVLLFSLTFGAWLWWGAYGVPAYQVPSPDKGGGLC